MTQCIPHLRREMENTPQDPLWHGEGNVWNHTGMVCQALQSLPEYRQADDRTRRALYLAAVFHDVGKIRATRQEDGRWIAPGHGRISAQMARESLWLDRGLCGSREAQQLREGVCGLIRYHSLPLHVLDEEDGRWRMLRFAATGSLTPVMTVENLCILAKADILGRLCPDQQELLEKVELCREFALESGCYSGAYPFPSDHSRFTFLSRERESPADSPIYDDTWGQVVMLCGLPGTGKDTWIRENCPELPMISLDDIRRERKISPLENQSRVVEEARERAKEFLRRKQPFVWNATNLSPMVRGRQVDLFTRYGASVRLVYLETHWAEQLRRNRNRADAVPEQALCRMLDILIPPEGFEAHRVEWICL